MPGPRAAHAAESDNDGAVQENASNSSNSGNVSDLVHGAMYFFVLQLCARLGTFAMNQYLLRLVTPEIFGLGNVQMELFVSSVLFFSREAFRSVLLRSSSDDASDATKKDQALRRIVNVAFLPMLLGLLITPAVLLYFVYGLEIPDVDHYYRCLAIYAAGTYIELLIEPLYIVSLSHLYLKLRVCAEAAATFAGCVTTFSLTYLGAVADKPAANHFGLLAFAWGRMAFGAAYVLVYLGFYLVQTFAQQPVDSALDIRNMRPRSATDPATGKSYYFDPKLLKLSYSFARQSVLKQLLTEGDKILLSSISTTSDQGVYAFVLNYGSLVVRIVFFPLEDAGRMIFARLLTGGETAPEALRRQSNMTMARGILALTIRFHVLLGLLFVCFGTNYTHAFVDLLAGKKWAGETMAPAVLALYCVYIPIMGVNGITEAFVTSVAGDDDIKRQSYAMVGFSFAFAATGVLSVKWLAAGAFGIILANMVNLTGRILWSWNFINGFFAKQAQQLRDSASTKSRPLLRKDWRLTWTEFVPKLPILLAFLASWAVTATASAMFGWATVVDKAQHIGVGVAMLSVCAFVVYRYDRELWVELRALATKQKSKQE
ncbi:Oligosaccharide translocation protein rft1 [Sorochytrium milnesiophthora]